MNYKGLIGLVLELIYKYRFKPILCIKVICYSIKNNIYIPWGFYGRNTEDAILWLRLFLIHKFNLMKFIRDVNIIKNSININRILTPIAIYEEIITWNELKR